MTKEREIHKRGHWLPNAFSWILAIAAAGLIVWKLAF